MLAALSLALMCFLLEGHFAACSPTPHQDGGSPISTIKLSAALSSPGPATPSSAACSLEEVSKLFSSNQYFLRKAILSYSAKHGVENTRQIIQDILDSAVTSTAKNVASNDEESGPQQSGEDAFETSVVDAGDALHHLRDPVLDSLPLPPTEMRPSWQVAHDDVGAEPKMPFVSTNHANQVVRFGGQGRPLPMGAAYPGHETVLIIPGRRLRPMGSRVRISAKNKNREVKITTSPQMSVLEALKAAELKIQWQWPELSNDKVIEFEHRDSLSCYVVTRVGPVESDEVHAWQIKVTTKSGEMIYRDLCLPSGQEVIVRPGSVVDLVYVPVPT